MTGLSKTEAKQVDDAIDANWEAQIGWLMELCRFETTRGNERPCQNWLAGEFRARDWTVDQFAISEVDIDGRPGASAIVDVDYAKADQIVATIPSGNSGRSLILQGHIDVVPAGPPDLWPHPPFEPQLRGDHLTGRGTSDMKCGVAEIVFALDALRRAGLKPAGQVFVETVSEEECTGNGALATLERGYTADACLIPEATGHRLVRAQLGSLWFRLDIVGIAAHVLDPGRGKSAILLAYEFIRQLENLVAEMNKEALEHPYFGHTQNPVSLNAGRINGGDWLGTMPAWCRLDCRISTLPGQDLAGLRGRIIGCIEDRARELGLSAPPALSWIGFQAEGYVLNPGSEAEATLASAHKEVIGTDLECFNFTATSDVRQYGLYYGIPALCYGGNGGGAHSTSEYLDLLSMRETTRILTRFIAAWCGTEKCTAIH